MSLVLKLGVNDLPYADAGGTGARTTGDVATILEAKYGVMETFAERHLTEISAALAESMNAALETVLMGGPAPADPLAPATEEIAEQFREFIDTEELAGVATGVPTAAALKGVSHRFKHPYARGHPRRPSFVDTGLYRESFTAWIEDE